MTQYGLMAWSVKTTLPKFLRISRQRMPSMKMNWRRKLITEILIQLPDEEIIRTNKCICVRSSWISENSHLLDLKDRLDRSSKL